MSTQRHSRFRLPFFGRPSDTQRALAAAQPKLYGIVAEFETPEGLVQAARTARAAGYRRMEGYSPFPIEDLSETIGYRTRLPLVVLCGGLTGAIFGFLFQWWISAYDYPINVGGRPLFSWPAFIPATFELMILFSAFAAVLGMIILNGLPRPYHSIFNTPDFENASRDKFFFCIEASDPKFDRQATRQLLERLSPLAISEVNE